MKVIWVGKDQPSYQDLKLYLEVRREIVQQALIGLKWDNPLYVNVEVDEEYLSSWPEKFISEALKTSMMIIDNKVSKFREQ